MLYISKYKTIFIKIWLCILSPLYNIVTKKSYLIFLCPVRPLYIRPCAQHIQQKVTLIKG